jgi:hypothetical protein
VLKIRVQILIFVPGFLTPHVKGTFYGDHAAWNSDEDSLILLATATLETRNALKEIAVDVRGMAQSGIYVNTLTAVVSGEVNARVTPGGAVNLTGVKIRIAGDMEKGVGLFLTDVNGGEPWKVSDGMIAINEPSKITFVVPTAGIYG